MKTPKTPFLWWLALSLPCISVSHAQGVTGSARSFEARSFGGAAHQPAPSPTTGQIYQQRQRDGQRVFTDRPYPDATTERSWSVPVEDPYTAERRRQQAREDARQEVLGVNERIQRQIERQRDREDALAIERMRLAQAQAWRDAEIARAERERAQNPFGVVVVPGASRSPAPYRPPHARPYPEPSHAINQPYPPRMDQEPSSYGAPYPVQRPVRSVPPVAATRPAVNICVGRPMDCNPGAVHGRIGFGGP